MCSKDRIKQNTVQTDYLETKLPLWLISNTNIDQKLLNSLHRLLNCEKGGLDYHVITTEYRTRVHCIHV